MTDAAFCLSSDRIAAGSNDPDDWERGLIFVTWHDSRSSGVALVIHPTACSDEMGGWAVRAIPKHMTAVQWQNFRVESQRKENDRRGRANDYVCAVVLMGYIEGRDVYARKLGAALGSAEAGHTLARDSVPTYNEMRNFLIGELDAHPVTAAAAAFRQVEFHNRLNARSRAAWFGDPPPELGWI